MQCKAIAPPRARAIPIRCVRAIPIRCVRALDATTRKKTREFPSRETRACVRARAALGLDRPSSTADEGHHVSR